MHVREYWTTVHRVLTVYLLFFFSMFSFHYVLGACCIVINGYDDSNKVNVFVDLIEERF